MTVSQLKNKQTNKQRYKRFIQPEFSHMQLKTESAAGGQWLVCGSTAWEGLSQALQASTVTDKSLFMCTCNGQDPASSGAKCQE